MNGRAIAYWGTTLLVAVSMLGGGVVDIVQPPDLVDIMTQLEYPMYFATILGIWKVGAGIALLVPRFPRLKEWAYAGIVFDLSGAALSHLAVDDPLQDALVPLAILVLTAVSWRLRPASRTL